MKAMRQADAKIVVLEIERVQIVRRKCRAHSRFCNKCKTSADFIPLRGAASLFGVNSARLFRFVQANDSHYDCDVNGRIFLCVKSLFDRVNAQADCPKIKMLGETEDTETNDDPTAEFS